MKRILKGPLLHFPLLGVALFAACSRVSKRGGDGPGKIVVGRGQIASMVESFARVRLRPPTPEELDGLIPGPAAAAPRPARPARPTRWWA